MHGDLIRKALHEPELLRLGVGGVVPIRWELAKAGQDPGELTGWASVYHVVDQQDDVVVPGAFRKTLGEWRASKRVITLTLDHENTAEGVIGSLADAEDTAYGLKMRFRFSSTSKAQDARTKAREGHLNGLSIFGPIVLKAFSNVAGKAVRVLKEVGLISVGLTPMPANTSALLITAKASDTPWSQFSPADYTSAQWRRACLIDTGTGEIGIKERYALPVREPGGALNRNGVHAAAGRLNQVDVPAAKRAVAARALIRLYAKLGEDPPDSLRRMAGMAAASLALPARWVTDMKAALAIGSVAAQKAAVDALVADVYQVPVDDPDQGGVAAADDGGDAHPQDSDVDEEAAKWALSVIGESGPGTRPPGGEPDDPLAELLASQGAVTTSAELDALAAELAAQQ